MNQKRTFFLQQVAVAAVMSLLLSVSAFSAPRYQWSGGWMHNYGGPTWVGSQGAAVSLSCANQKRLIETGGGSCEFREKSCSASGVSVESGGSVIKVQIQAIYSKKCGDTVFPDLEYSGQVVGGLAVLSIPPPGDSCGPGGVPSSSTGRPINTAIGNKHYRDVDFRGGGLFPLEFVRYYNSKPSTAPEGSYPVGLWSHSYNQHIAVTESASQMTASVKRPDGSAHQFSSLDDGVTWIPSLHLTTAELKATKNENGDIIGWLYKRVDNVTETYDASGFLSEIEDLSGIKHIITTAGNTVTVTHSNGQSLVLAYKYHNWYEGFTDISSMTDPDGNTYTYGYGEDGAKLSSVTYPDPDPTDDIPPPSRTYLYGNVRYITGIVDERGALISSVSYDSSGRAIQSQGAGGVGKSSIVYDNVNTATITNALGKQTIYRFWAVQGVKKLAEVEGQPTSNCVGDFRTFTYDGRGFVSSKTDARGNITNYVRNTSGLELSRTEAVGKPEERIVTTQWHPEFNLPAKITEPGRETSFIYDAAGRLLNKTITPIAAP